MQGLGSPGGPGALIILRANALILTSLPENPIWTLAKKWGLNNTYSNYSSILTYNETGYTDFSALLDEYETKFETASDLAGTILKENYQDMTVRSGLSLADWKPKRDDMTAQAVEWWEWGKSFFLPMQFFHLSN